MDRHKGGLRERVVPSWYFESFIWVISSGFPLANHLALPGSESVFGLSQDPLMYACASLSQDGFQQRGLWVVDITYYGVTPLPFLSSKEPFYACVVGKLSLTSRMRNTWSLIWAGLSSSSSSSWSFCPQGTNSSCSAWDQSISYLRMSY